MAHDLLTVEVELAELGPGGQAGPGRDGGLHHPAALDHRVAQAPLVGHGQDAAPGLPLDVLQQLLDGLLPALRSHSRALLEPVQHSLDLADQDLAGEGLGDVVHDSEAEGPHPLAELAVRGQEHHREAGGVRVGLEGLQHAVAVELGHRDVAEDEVGDLAPRQLHGRRGIARGDHGMAGGAQQLLDQAADRLLVLHQEDLATRVVQGFAPLTDGPGHPRPGRPP